MRIAEINMLHYGSTGKIMLGVAACARESGHEVRCFSPRAYQRYGKMPTPKIENHTYFGSHWENMFHYILSRLTGFTGCGSVVGTKQLLRKLDAFQPDIIHLHNLHNCSICVPMLFRYIKKRNIPTVWTLHDCWSMTGKCPHFTMVKCDKWKTGCHQCGQINEYPKSFVDRTKTMWKWKKKWFTGVENLTIVTPSQWLADLVKQSYLKDYPVRVIHNGIDLNVFKPTPSDFREKHGISQDERVILGVAFGWGKRKGLDVFVELAKRLNKSFRIVLVGTSDEIDAELPDSVLSIHTTQNQKELAEIYSVADLFVNPTREENYPTVNMEAIACGTPVLTFRTGGSPEILNEKTGVVVPCEDMDALEGAIRMICEKQLLKREDCLSWAKEFDQMGRYMEYVSLFEANGKIRNRR